MTGVKQAPAGRGKRTRVSVAERRAEETVAAGGLEQVYLLHRPQLLRFLRARGGGDSAEDLLQELWLRASTSASGPITDPLSYLYRAANNLMLDRRREAIRRARREEEFAAPDVAAEAPSGERALIAREQLEAVSQALGALGDRTATIFRRYRLDGRSQRDIAAEEGISLSAVEKHLQRAYRTLIDLRRRFDAG